MELEKRIDEVVREVWGYEGLRPFQREAILAGLEGRDSLVVLPTGGGKSLCYQVPPLIAGRAHIVVSPLISLMKDQVDALVLNGYPAAAIHSGMTPAERGQIYRQARNGKLSLVFVSPERLQTEGFQSLIRDLEVGAFAVDEAHCISHWGHDFRQDYRRLRMLKERFDGVAVHAFTATATPRVRQDILDQLGLIDPMVLVGTFDRPNLVYRVLPKSKTRNQLEKAVRRHGTEGIIVYCLSRKETEQLAEFLRIRGIQARAYHAGLDPAERTRIQEVFAREEINVVVATVAFGMGIDRSNVRLVVHTSIPSSIEQYQQETGRAGRDGLPAECLMLYSYADVIRWQHLFAKSSEEMQKEVLEARLALLSEMQAFCNSLECRHRALSAYFGQDYPNSSCGACDVCLDEVDALADSNQIAQKILSCVYHLRQSFGVNHLIEVLRGSKALKVRQLGHDRLSTYGILSEVPDQALKNLVYQLLDRGVLERSGEPYPVVKLTRGGAEVLKGHREVRLKQPEVMVLSRPGGGLLELDPDQEIFEALRSLRRDLAQSMKVPAYVIFNDKTLREMAVRKPLTTEEFLDLPGVGAHKMKRFGKAFLELIRGFRERNRQG